MCQDSVLRRTLKLWSILTNNTLTFLSGLGFTLAARLLAYIGSYIVGTLFALHTISHFKPLRVLGHFYVTVVRKLPLLVITLDFYDIVPQFIVKIDGFTAGTLGLYIYTSALLATTVRAGITAVPSGQNTGARSIGNTYTQANTQIIFPQDFKIVLPPLGNQFINLVKNSSVLAFVAGLHHMYQGKLIAATTFSTLHTYLIVGLFYYIYTMPYSYLMRYLELKWDTA